MGYQLVTRLICVLYFLDGCRFFTEPAGIFCHAFEALSMRLHFIRVKSDSLPIIFNFFFRAGFVHLLRMSSRFKE